MTNKALNKLKHIFGEDANFSEIVSSVPSRSNPRWSSVVEISDNHIRFKRNATYQPKRDKIQKRGKISGFSRHSRLRLRDSLATSCLADSEVYGLTLTVPWKGDDFCALLPFYRECFNRFGVAFRRAFPASAAIFRHELQVRRAPHCHLVLYLSKFDLARIDSDLKGLFFAMWLKALKGDMIGGSLFHFARRGIKLDKLSDQAAMFRYISDHASKSKQAQLGYKGKQWGFLNRQVLSNRVRVPCQFRFQEDLYFFQRHIRKVCRFQIDDKEIAKKSRFKPGRSKDYFKERLSRAKAKPFGGVRKSHPLDRVSVCFVSDRTSYQIIEYLNRHRRACLL